jgi:proteasome lid subunit RPN8/RPN11
MRYKLRGEDLMQWSEQKPDFCHVAESALFATLPFPLPVLVTLRPRTEAIVLFDRSVDRAIREHLIQRKVEMGGLLIGQVAKRGDGGLLIRIDNHAESDEFDSSSVSLQMSPSVWGAAREKITDLHYVVGWYHSHPNLGAFFSGTDRKTQRAFFRESHSIGLVIDPIRNEEAWFVGPDSLPIGSGNILRY